MSNYNSIARTEVIGHFGVDSGTVMIIDPCYVLKDERVLDPKGAIFGETSEYLRTVESTCESPWHGPVLLDEYPGQDMGVVCGTLWGDGTYPVIAEYNNSGRIVRLIIDFDYEGDDEEEEDDLIDGECDDCGETIPLGHTDWYEGRDGSTHYVCRNCKDNHDDEMEDDDEEQ